MAVPDRRIGLVAGPPSFRTIAGRNPVGPSDSIFSTAVR